MYCMRCGRELKTEGQVFCPDCQDIMRKHPVAPGTPIHIHQRAAIPYSKKRSARRKKELKPEEQIAKLRSSNRLLTFMLFVMTVAFALACAVLLYTYDIPFLPF